ncbi:response regulator transcription factor [Solirhodobacter olei]|uniref:response regulator transcription factor n=1 Tax=Solirhodobacter olei TaxID=2493082 RepID=UPI000FDAA9E7|nr:response regulator transcription factor [Solirhodobacter olei]
MRLLIVEDNLNLAEWLARLLRRDAYVVDTVPDGETVLQGVDADLYDLAIVDLGLPGIGGIEVVRHLRKTGCEAPILILTAEEAVKSRVAGLDAGADDYVTKPFEVEELEARIRALLRRRKAPVSQTLSFGPLSFDEGARLFSLAGAPLALSRREHTILETLIRRAGMAVSKEALLEATYGFEEDVSPSAIEVVVHRLRRKLEGTPVSIATLRGFGYILRQDAQ